MVLKTKAAQRGPCGLVSFLRYILRRTDDGANCGAPAPPPITNHQSPITAVPYGAVAFTGALSAL